MNEILRENARMSRTNGSLSRGCKNRSEMISDNVKRDQRHVHDESVTGICPLHRLGKVAPIRRYVTTNPRNWSNYKAQRAILYGNAIDTPEIERNATVETNRDREGKRMGGVNRRERKRRRKIKDEERKIRAIHDGWTTLVYYVSVIRCSLRSIDE